MGYKNEEKIVGSKALRVNDLSIYDMLLRKSAELRFSFVRMRGE